MKISIGVRARTLSRLRTSQVLLRPWGRHAHRFVPRRSVTVATGALARAMEWAGRVRSIHGIPWEEQGSRAADGLWRYIGLEVRGPLPPFRADAPRLWRYELHYRVWLAGLAELRNSGDLPEEAWRRQVAASLESCTADSEAWEPYVLARRIPNELAAAGIARDDSILLSAARAAGALRFMPEIHLAANHLLVDRAALALAALVLGGEADSAAERRFVAECAAQTDAEGLHEERSPWYALLAWLDLQNVIEARRIAGGGDGELEEIVKRQQEAFAHLIHPDGTFAAFHDSPSDHPYVVLARSLAASEVGAWRLASSCFCGWRGNVLGKSLSLVMDAGEVRPRHQPSHQHASPLAIELWWGGPWIRSLGVSTYEASPRRLYERGVRAYATIQIDDLEAAEIWSAFRMGRDYRMTELDYHETEDGLRAGCSHDGFRGVVVTRQLDFSITERRMTITDRCSSPGGKFHTLKSRLPLAHDVIAKRVGTTIRLEREDAFIDVTTSQSADVTIEQDIAHSAFGVALDTNVIVMTTSGKGEIALSFELALGSTR